MKRRNPTWLCQERARGARCCTRDEGGPFGAGLQEQASNSRELLPSNGGGGERSRKRRDSRVMCGLERRAQANHCRGLERILQLASKPERPRSSGKSMADTWLLAMRCPGYRWRDSSLGSGTELENLFGGAKGKGASGGPARPKVPRLRAGADCSVVAMKRVTTAERRGQAIRVVIDLVNR
jgi:hypothetical protein